MSLLELQGVTAAYGPVQALFGVDLEVGEGEVVALMGRNWMGKTTTIRAVCRMMPFGGSVRFSGVDLAGMASHKAAHLGIGLVPEGRRCFGNLTVEENLRVAARGDGWQLADIYELFPPWRSGRGRWRRRSRAASSRCWRWAVRS